MLQYYDITVPTTGSDFQVAAPGRFLYFLNGSAGGADNTIKVKAGNTGSTFLLKPGQSVRLDPADKSVDTWYISNYAKAGAIIGQVLVGDGDFQDNTLSGVVSVVDGGKQRTLGGSAFMVGIGIQATAGQFAAAQLWNPAGSGKNLVVEKISASHNVAGGAIIDIGKLAAALTTAGSATINKQFGSGVGSAGLSKQQSGAALALGAGQVVFGLNLNAGIPLILPLNEPIIVPPGYGLTIQCETAAAALLGSFEWFEEGI